MSTQIATLSPAYHDRIRYLVGQLQVWLILMAYLVEYEKRSMRVTRITAVEIGDRVELPSLDTPELASEREGIQHALSEVHQMQGQDLSLNHCVDRIKATSAAMKDNLGEEPLLPFQGDPTA